MEIRTGFTSFFLNKEEAIASNNLFNFVFANNGLFEIVKEELYTTSLKRKKGFKLPLSFDGRKEFELDNNKIILSKNGTEIEMKKYNFVTTWVYPFANKMEHFFDFNFPKIPFEILLEIIWFFKVVWKHYSTEIMLELFFNNETKSYELICPKQIISPTKVVYLKEEAPPNYKKILEIHSHNVMPAIFSTTDDADEKDGNLIYGVIGNFSPKNTNCKLSFRIFSKGQFKNVHMDSIFEKRPEDFDSKKVEEKFKKHYSIWKNNIELSPVFSNKKNTNPS